MQTFLPYPSFYYSLQCLDKKRLGKQRVEAWQILHAITYPEYGWQNHPAVTMWRKNLLALTMYYNTSLDVWELKGGRNIKLKRFPFVARYENPEWLGNSDFHASHRSNLLRKDPLHYGQFCWTEPNNLPYVWPK